MYINPNTTIKILHNVPLDDTYEHTIYFANSSAQNSYFSGLAKYTFEEQTYQRVKRGYIRIAKNAESLYDCNYLMFQNSAFGNKWFYAFIKSVEYINNGVSEIEFEIDVMQTWYFDYHLQDCFVEREHSATDEAGDNIVPENLEKGEYIIYGMTKAGVGATLEYMVDATITKEYEDILAHGYNINEKNIMSGLNVISFGTDTTELASWLNGKGNSENEVKVRNGVMNIRLGTPAKKSYIEYGRPFINVKNKKLLTYPYCFCYVTNFNGNSASYPFEYFTNGIANFYLCTDEMPASPAVLYPANYKGLLENTDEKITLNNFPTVGWSSSYYDYWLAQAQTTKVPNLVTNVLGGVATGAVATGGNPIGVAVGAGVGALSSVINLMCERNWAEKQPPQSHSTNSGMTDYWNGTIDFGIMTKSITPEMARTIDDYFSRFGYATHRNKVPNTAVRPHWCYTKTVGCTIKGSIPADDMRKICSIYDKGITFWKKGDEVGNYTLDNTV